MAPQVGARSFVGATSSSRRSHFNPATATTRSRSNATSSILDLHCDPSVGSSAQCGQSRGGGEPLSSCSCRVCCSWSLSDRLGRGSSHFQASPDDPGEWQCQGGYDSLCR